MFLRIIECQFLIRNRGYPKRKTFWLKLRYNFFVFLSKTKLVKTVSAVFEPLESDLNSKSQLDFRPKTKTPEALILDK